MLMHGLADALTAFICNPLVNNVYHAISATIAGSCQELSEESRVDIDLVR